MNLTAELHMLNLRRLILLAVCMISFPRIAEAQLNQLITRAPAESNSLVVIDAQAVLASPMARAGDWDDGRRQAHRSGMLGLPADVNYFLMAAEIDYEFMQPLWEIAVAHMPQRPTMKEVAEHCGGRIDRLSGSEAVERPNDSFVVAFGPRIIGAASPANRQQVIRWVRESRVKRAPDLSDYLTEAITAVEEKSAQMVLAFDLSGLLAESEVAAKLADSEALTGASIDTKAAASVIAGIKGVRLEIKFEEAAKARLRLSFSENPNSIESVSGLLVTEILTKRGAKVQDISSWAARQEKNDIVLEGKLSESGLRRVLSVLSGPVGPWAQPAPYETTPENAAGEISRSFFQSVTGYLDDLFVDNVNQPQSLYQVEVWVERYARKIEDLDTSGVDPDVLTFANDVVIRLREIGTTLQRAQQRSDLRESTMWDSGRNRYGRYGTYGFFEKGYITRDRHLIQADEGLRGLRESSVIVDEMRELSANTRQAMTERYGIPF